MSSTPRDPSHPTTDTDAAKTLDGPAPADYASSDMAHAVERAEREHHREHATEAEAARRVDGPIATDYPSSDMPRAVDEAKRED